MISVEGLAKVYRGGTPALKGLTFDVPRGEIFGFVGRNGAGKTTCLRILATLMAPTAGAARIDGFDVVADPVGVRDLIGYMPDFFGVYDRLTAAEYLAFYASCYRIPHVRCTRIAADLLELINLADKRDAPVDSLSRGMKQRLCLARALVHDPAVLLLDEPASGLDPRARVDMRDLLTELQRMGKTIVISSHILPELAEMCSSFGIIEGGRMVATGSLADLTGGEVRRRSRVVVAGDPEDAVRRASGASGVLGAEREGAASIDVEYEGDGPESAAALTAALVRAGVQVVSIVPLESDLESIFLRATEGEGAA